MYYESSIVKEQVVATVNFENIVTVPRHQGISNFSKLREIYSSLSQPKKSTSKVFPNYLFF
jgi:hypothetical protein